MLLRDSFSTTIKGHVKIVDDLGNVLVDKYNAVHPQNMARVIARALANESNYSIYRIAFGNGGTTTDAAFTVSFNPANDGQPPDTRTWDSRIYNETYSEIIDEGNVVLNDLLGTDPGTADPNVGTRIGGGSVKASDPTSTRHTSGPGIRSIEQGTFSQVIITCVINPDEPTGQVEQVGSGDPYFGNAFSFDEIGLYTGGARASASSGVADINVGNKNSDDDSGLVRGTTYEFRIAVDGGSANTVRFTVPAGTGAVTLGDLCEAINTGDVTWNPNWGGISPLPGKATVAITDDTLNYSSITGAQTYGFLRFSSATVGSSSSIDILSGLANTDMVVNLDGYIDVQTEPGEDAGIQNDPVSPELERERLLTHIVFSPVLKAAQRTLTVTYTLTISVARTPQA